MGWDLEIVDRQTGERRLIFEFGSIAAPESHDQVGLNPKLGQDVLRRLQDWIVSRQEEAIKNKAKTLRQVHSDFRLKDYRSKQFHTLFGKVSLRVPRLVSIRSNNVPPDLLRSSEGAGSHYDRLRAKLGAWMSFRAADLFLREMFPHASSTGRTTLQRKVLSCARSSSQCEPAQDAVQGRGEVEIGIDTTFVRNADKKGPRSLEILVGTGRNSLGKLACIAGAADGIDGPAQPINTMLSALASFKDTQVTCFTDGDALLRALLREAGIAARPILDWHHIAQRIQTTKQIASALRCVTDRERRAKPKLIDALESLHWRLWHGRVSPALSLLEALPKLLRAFYIGRSRSPSAARVKRLKVAVTKLHAYITNQAVHLVNYAERQRSGRLVGTSPTEGMVNALVAKRMKKSQQMAWSADGAHAVLTVRSRIMNDNFPASDATARVAA